MDVLKINDDDDDDELLVTQSANDVAHVVISKLMVCISEAYTYVTRPF